MSRFPPNAALAAQRWSVGETELEPVLLRNVTFAAWLRSHGKKDPEERWLRELYPWPVLAQVDCDAKNVGQTQRISYDGADYDVTLSSVRWQPQHGTFKYRLLVESDGLGWHSRSFSDQFDMCGCSGRRLCNPIPHQEGGAPREDCEGVLWTRWDDLRTDSFRSLAVSRFLAASIVGQMAEQRSGTPH